MADVVDCGFGGSESAAGRGELSGCVVELTGAAGGLAAEDVLVGCDRPAELGVEHPRVVDGGHGGVGNPGQGDRNLVVGIGSVREPTAEVDRREHGGVPAVGGVDGA